MAMNMPIVSTNVGSIEGIIINCENGLLINEPKNMNEYAKVIGDLLHSEELRRLVADSGFNRAVNEFEWNKVFKIYRENLYSKVSLTEE